jgi:hypothetical protein
MGVTSITFPFGAAAFRAGRSGEARRAMELTPPGRIEEADLAAGGRARPSARSKRRYLKLDRKSFCCGGNAMPRYFFDLVDDKKIYDKKGVSLPNDKAAREYAKTFARELMETKSDLLGESWQAWSVQVCNGKFDRILRIPFSDVVEPKP